MLILLQEETPGKKKKMKLNITLSKTVSQRLEALYLIHCSKCRELNIDHITWNDFVSANFTNWILNKFNESVKDQEKTEIDLDVPFD